MSRSRRKPTTWTNYGPCGCGALAQKACIDTRMAGSVRVVTGRPHVGRPRLPRDQR